MLNLIFIIKFSDKIRNFLVSKSINLGLTEFKRSIKKFLNIKPKAYFKDFSHFSILQD